MTEGRALSWAASQRLGHLLGVNGFFTSLAGAGRASGGTSALTEWWSERRCAAEFGGIVRPDGTVEHVHYLPVLPETPFPGLVEFDATTMATAMLEVATQALADEGGPVQAVGIPIAWGVWVTLKSALVLFG